eukprot:gene8820-11909_t
MYHSFLFIIISVAPLLCSFSFSVFIYPQTTCTSGKHHGGNILNGKAKNRCRERERELNFKLYDSPTQFDEDINNIPLINPISLTAQTDISSNINEIDQIRVINEPKSIISQDQSDHINSWPCGDALDKRIIQLALPAIVNFAIIPLVGAADTFWVGRMKDALALAGQGAANQVFSSAFWIISFLPNVITPLVAKAAGSGDSDMIQNTVGEAIFIGSLLGIFGTILLTYLPHLALSSVLPLSAPAYAYASPYLTIRALTFLPALLSTVGFSAFRGTMDIVTPLRISALANLINIILDPFLIFNMKMGVSGAALATGISEVAGFLLYMNELIKRGMLKWTKLFRIPSWKSLKPLFLGGLSVQLRAVALNLAFIAVTRTTQKLDSSGTVAAAHAISMQFWQLGGVILLAMSSVASIIVPNELAKSKKSMPNAPLKKQLLPAKQAADRMMWWGVLLGIVLSSAQLLSLPLLNIFSPLPEVQNAAKLPAMIGACLQLINGVVFIGEGIQQGNQYFLSLAACTGLATVGMLTSLRFFGHTLAGVWASFAVFNFIRLMGVLRHHFIDGPLVDRTSPKVRYQYSI